MGDNRTILSQGNSTALRVPTAEELIRAANTCRALGLSPIPISNKKRAVIKWKKFQDRIATEEELEPPFHYSFTKGIAVICGPVSGNLEVIDVDVKNDLSGRLMRQFYDLINRADPYLAKKLVIARTRSGGYHLFYRADAVEKNQVLAKRLATEAELLAGPEQKEKVLIETRAKGGIACIEPTPGYTFIRGSLATIPLITGCQRDIVLASARSFNQVKQPEKIKRLPQQRTVASFDPESPIEDYNQRGDVIELLEKHGWLKGKDRNGKTEFLRPGNTDKANSGNFDHQRNLFSVFTTSTRFKPEKGYTPASVYAILECGGDDRLAAKRLLQEGYGVPYNKRKLRK